AEALLYPEVSRLGTNPKSLERSIVNNALQILEKESLARVWARLTPSELETFELNLRLEPPQKDSDWREAIDLRIDVVRWSLSESMHIAFIPALGIEVIGRKLSDLKPSNSRDSLLERHARAELQRKGVLVHFVSLLLLERTRALTLSRVPATAVIRTPKQVMATSGQTDQKKSALEENALDLVMQRLSPAFEVDEKLTELADALKGKGARSVLLVGKAGVGKTALVHALVRRRSDFGFASTPFWATSGARLVAGMTGYGMWQDRCDAFWKDAEKIGAIVHFGNLVELMDTGKSEGNAQGVASFLRQRFARGQALAILECTPEQLPLIEREDPAILTVLRQLTVEEPSPEASRKILREFAMRSRFDLNATVENRRRLAKRLVREPTTASISEAALERVDRLHRRYAGYSAYPARPLRFLRGLLQKRRHFAEQVPEITVADATAAFAKETGLPSFLLDDEVSFDVDRTTRWFEERVIGQRAAVKLIVELLATTKAGLTRPRRPIASLLFTGPTGTGKTEMAKSLARFFFGDERRMARFDMSEYADASAVTRLVGGLTGGEGTLTARIREQPFSVLLFDEFEKADSSFFDLLLQMLGDGRLTDGRGRLADFTNSIVVMTSNLGAQLFRRSRAGFETDSRDEAVASRKAQRDFTHAVQEFLRPEIFNRIDHIVPFVPLDPVTVELIAKRELKLIEDRNGLRLRGVSLDVSQEVIADLAKRGYDNSYGARSLKRLIEREILTPLAIQLNQQVHPKRTRPLKAGVFIDGRRLCVNVTEQAESVRLGDKEAAIAFRAERLGDLRRRLVRLDRSSAVLELRNTIWRLMEIERRIARVARRAKLTKKIVKARYVLQQPWEASVLARLPEYRDRAAKLATLLDETANAEDQTLLMLYQRETSETEAGKSIDQLESELNVLLRQLLDLRYNHPDRITLALYSENTHALFELARAYYLSAKASGMNVTVWHYTANIPPDIIEEEERRAAALARKKKKDEEKEEKEEKEDEKSKIIEMFERKVTRLEVMKASEFLSDAPGSTTAVILGITGKSALPIYGVEHGLHAFIQGKTTNRLLVHTSDIDVKDYRAPTAFARRGSISPVNYGECRRTYHRTDAYIEDHQIPQRRDWRNDLVEAVQSFTQQLHKLTAEKLIDE
ncbi:MAG TPA: AAA family ATPase, partial [Pyrinomonadaceae bacterium]|nr:AAA family ATPase [Pyrinomonadaceae bacterium]